jgi:hypothetical protein
MDLVLFSNLRGNAAQCTGFTGLGDLDVSVIKSNGIRRGPPHSQ